MKEKSRELGRKRKRRARMRCLFKLVNIEKEVRSIMSEFSKQTRLAGPNITRYIHSADFDLDYFGIAVLHNALAAHSTL